MTHMYSRPDLKGPLPLPTIHADTVLHYLYTHGYQKFVEILKKGNFAGKFNDSQTYNTLIVPEQFPEGLSYYDTNVLLQRHIIPYSVDCKFLKGRGMGPNRMFLNTLGGDQIMSDWPFIGSCHIKSLKFAGNATIIFVSGGPIMPLR